MHLDANAPHHNDELMIRLCEIVVFDPHLFVFEAGGGSRCSVLRHPDRSWRRDFQEELAWGLLHNPPPAVARTLPLPLMSLFSAVDVTVPRDKNPKVGPVAARSADLFAKAATCDKSNTARDGELPFS